MKIDYEKNTLAIVKRFAIPYGEGLYLEGRIRGIIEDGFDEVNWLQGEVVYNNHPDHHPEVGGMQFDRFYQAFKRGVETSSKDIKKGLREMERRLRSWCWCSMSHLEISDVVLVTDGIRV